MSAITEKSDLPYYEVGTEEDHDDEDSHPHFEDEGGKSILPAFVTNSSVNPITYVLFIAVGVGLIFLFRNKSGHKHKSAVKA